MAEAMIKKGDGYRSTVATGVVNELFAKNWVDGASEFDLERLVFGIGKGIGLGIVVGLAGRKFYDDKKAKPATKPHN